MDLVADIYDKDPQGEWRRLERDAYHSLEFQVTMHFLRKHLPPAGTVLDAGGGPGRYAIALCRAGYHVVLLDLSSGVIAKAKEMFDLEPPSVRSNLLECAVGDIRDLSRFESGQFDAVLCLGGPLSHINDAREREQAMVELVRVAKPGGVVAVAVIGYLALLRTILMGFTDELVDPVCHDLLQRGDAVARGTVWHFFRAEELRRLAESCGLTTLEMAGCEGLSTGLGDATNRCAANDALWQRWLEWVLASAAEPAVVDMAEHILYIGRHSAG
jgi:SAM-dependent methyltransferase